ncbi:hypothetical protein ACIRPH_18530 [Nocardiopsis sp. NPDC101807]|uniref:hypothetical protein n=1 Tax=Nocardiopsis sp. NPDC101807 TaxID=3364339 RepID=UPI003815C83F
MIWTPRSRLGPERRAARTAEGLRVRVCRRVCALNAAIWHDWLVGVPVKRSSVAHDR